MSQILQTIEEYIAQTRKKDTIFISFNEEYAKAFMGIREPSVEEGFMSWLDKDKTNWAKREAFKQFIVETMPKIKLTDVYDNVPIGYIEWPFLGTIAIDAEIDSPEYNAINSRYEDETGNPISLDAVVWIMTYEQAKKLHAKKEAFLEGEFE
ncbi:hypothetical protein [Sulfuricurvum sp.]|uniref:hypothetical protein n=1 Tax=Sulfuricurvum sp. TaxID=2025608 RepID=UPI00262977E8|nr:hypothetical protein [Sulfuricurvum sp.]MDD3595887.1 hypothetical protein [Sulfuricurvum sp.]